MSKHTSGSRRADPGTFGSSTTAKSAWDVVMTLRTESNEGSRNDAEWRSTNSFDLRLDGDVNSCGRGIVATRFFLLFPPLSSVVCYFLFLHLPLVCFFFLPSPCVFSPSPLLVSFPPVCFSPPFRSSPPSSLVCFSYPSSLFFFLKTDVFFAEAKPGRPSAAEKELMDFCQ